MRNPNLSKRAIGCLGLTVVCVAIILLIFGAQTSLAHSPQHAERVSTSDDSAWSVLPLLWLLLPVAAVAAYFLERAGSASSFGHYLALSRAYLSRLESIYART